MSAAVEPEIIPANAIATVRENPRVVFTDPAAFDSFFAAVTEMADAVPADITIEANRREVVSMAAKITSTKTAIDKARLALTQHHRDEVARINDAGKVMISRLADLAERVRRPVTEWEQAEKDRLKRHHDTMARIAALGTLDHDETSPQIASRIDILRGMDLSPSVMDEFAEPAAQARNAVLALLEAAHARAAKAEAERAELDRLRREAAERAERERQEAEARAAEECARREEEERIRREAEIARAAEERARQEAEARVRAAEEAKRKAEEEAIRREEAARQAALAEAAARERQREEEERQRRLEEGRRAADIEHRRKTIDEATAAIAAVAGISAAKAQKIVSAIAAGDVPNVAIRF